METVTLSYRKSFTAGMKIDFGDRTMREGEDYSVDYSEGYIPKAGDTPLLATIMHALINVGHCRIYSVRVQRSSIIVRRKLGCSEYDVMARVREAIQLQGLLVVKPGQVYVL